MAVKPPPAFVTCVTTGAPGIDTVTDSLAAKPEPVMTVEFPAMSAAGSAVMTGVNTMAVTVTVAVAGVCDTAPSAVTTSGPAVVPAGTVMPTENSPAPFVVAGTAVPPGTVTVIDSLAAKPVPVMSVAPPAVTVLGFATIAVAYASTVSSASAGVAEVAPTAVTVTGPAGVPAGTGRVAVKPPAPFAVTTTGSPPGIETLTDSPGRKPEPVTVVLWPGFSVSGVSVIAVS